MALEEIIKEAAAEHRDCVCCGFYDPIADDKEASFIVGAEWEHKRLVEKACEWLESALKSDLGYYGAAEFADTFRKVMEE